MQFVAAQLHYPLNSYDEVCEGRFRKKAKFCIYQGKAAKNRHLSFDLDENYQPDVVFSF